MESAECDHAWTSVQQYRKPAEHLLCLTCYRVKFKGHWLGINSKLTEKLERLR